MKKEVNFRIIELPTHQVLLSKDFDEDEDDKPLLVVTVFIKGMKANQKFGYASEATRDEFFNSFSDKQAEKILDNIKNMFN